MKFIEPAVLLREYELHDISLHELVLLLCQSAVDRPPEQLAAALPEGVLAEVRTWAANPPISPDRCLVARSYSNDSAGPDGPSTFELESRRLFDGLWLWHRYFAVAEPGGS